MAGAARAEEAMAAAATEGVAMEGAAPAPPSPALRSQPSPKTLRPSRDAPSAPLDLSALPEDVSDEEAATLQAMRDYIRAASVVKLAKVSRR